MNNTINTIFKFADGSINTFPLDYKFVLFKPVYKYSSNTLGFGHWIKL